jgi:4-amino-4-deoxy-L-arabinose transferase-like glycosyltransferase
LTSDWQNRKTTPLLLGIITLGLCVRLIHFWAISDTALAKFHSVPDTDIHTFWNWAQQILAGDVLSAYHRYKGFMQEIAPLETWYRWWGGKEIFRTAPLFPYAVAGLLAVSGGSLLFVLFVQLLVGAIHPLVLFGLARRVFDERVGLAAAGLTALYGPFIFYQGVLLRDWLPPFLEPLALLLLLRARENRRGRDWLLAGAALGLALCSGFSGT